MKKLLFFSFLAFSCILNAQTLTYEVVTGKNYLGEIIVMHIESKENQTLKINAVGNISFHLFKLINLNYELNTVFKAGELYYSSVIIYINGKEHSRTMTEQKGEHYTISKDAKSTLYLKNIIYSGSLLYFKEPVGILKIFSEFDGFEKQVKKSGVHHYQVINAKNGQISEYYYNEGILQEAIIHHPLMSFKIILK